MPRPRPAFPPPPLRPMPADLVGQALVGELQRRGGTVHSRWLEGQPATYAAWPADLDARLVEALRSAGIHRPYSHQAEAISAALSRRSVVIVTPTASGKTLCYNVPVLQTLLRDSSTRALYLFPTKALAQDQLDELLRLVGQLGVDLGVHTYDGDTAPEARRVVRSAAHIVLTNPDMLHTGILPHHTRWARLFEGLEYVVIDELHHYRGVFGAHVANVIRRLRRICQFYGSDPTFILCSATIGNAGELARAIIGEPAVVVDRSGAPTSDRFLVIYNPPVVNPQLGIRQSSLLAGRDVAARLLLAGLQTIVFAGSRLRVELLLTYLRDALRERPGAAERVAGYRGGYLPNERRRIEAGLRDETIRGVVATNALELGIDIGGLAASVVVGYPGSIASLWQQFGRAGRRDEPALSVLVTSSNPLDQYLAAHPEFIFEAPVERGLVDPDNLYVLGSHVKCAAFELPFEEGETFGPHTEEMLHLLVEDGVLQRAKGRYYWMSDSFPAENVSLRTASTDNFVIIEEGPVPRVIGECDRPSAPLLIHEDAIYIHGGQQYQVERLDWDDKKAYVRPVAVDYYTDAELAVDLKVLDVAESAATDALTAEHGEVALTFLATIFKKVKLRTHENVGWGRIAIPEETMHTMAAWFAFGPTATSSLGRHELAAGLEGIAHLARGLVPVFCLCDPRDVGVDVQVRSPHTNRPTVFVYDLVPGGVGLAPRIFELRRDLLLACLDTVRSCDCRWGCPSCVGAQIDPRSPAKEAAVRLLERALGPRSPEDEP